MLEGDRTAPAHRSAAAVTVQFTGTISGGAVIVHVSRLRPKSEDAGTAEFVVTAPTGWA